MSDRRDYEFVLMIAVCVNDCDKQFFPQILCFELISSIVDEMKFHVVDDFLDKVCVEHV